MASHSGSANGSGRIASEAFRSAQWERNRPLERRVDVMPQWYGSY